MTFGDEGQEKSNGINEVKWKVAPNSKESKLIQGKGPQKESSQTNSRGVSDLMFFFLSSRIYQDITSEII